MCNIKLIFDKLQRITAKQKLIVYFLVKCKNQINKIIAYSLVADHIFKKSGEELIIKHLSPFLKNCVDVGANTGEWSEMILENSNFSIQQIVILEPGKLAFAKLANKFSSDKRLILLNNGLAHINSNLSFNELNDAGETSSFVRFPNDGDGNNLIEVFKYDTLMDNLSIKYIDYLNDFDMVPNPNKVV